MARRGLIKNRKSCSTPKTFISDVPSISISSITSNSSSSVERLRRRSKRRLREQVDNEAEGEQKKKKKKKKKEQHAVPKRKSRKEHVKRKEPETSDSSWETILEFRNDENLQPRKSSPMTPLLLQSRPSPTLERVREAHCFYNFHFDSPLPRYDENAASPVKTDLGNGVELLHLKDLPSVHPLVYSSDEEDDLLLTRHHNKPLKTYPGVRHRRKPKISVDTSRRWHYDVKWPTAVADMLWDDYVQTHPEEMREYCAPVTDQNVASFPKRKRNNYGTDKAPEEHGDLYRFGNEKTPKDTCYRISGHYNKFTKKWTQIPEAKDADSDFGRTKAGAPWMTLNQYLRKCRDRKHLASEMTDPSCSKYDEATNVTSRKRKIVNVEDVNDLRMSKSSKRQPVIRCIETGIRYIRKGSKWLIKRR
ncbi:uncharacterized protein LOC117226141 [Megalopta genalis]|uniref:uncharacterized protein LOC117226141 n=1 Tax=Megalopta genalis TaxID=115081 RepID=UPI003FD22A64